MADLATWPDVAYVLSEVLADLFPADRVVRQRTPSDLEQKLPLCRVRRIGGSAVDRITDRPRVDVDVFGGTYVQARDLALLCEQRILNYPRSVPSGVLDWAEPEVGPHEVPYSNPAVRLVTATYLTSLRRS